MPRRKRIPFPVEIGRATPGPWAVGLAILQEIRHKLERLVATGQESLIDLGAVPFAPDDEARLLALLGQGEVTVGIEALGPTRIWETEVPGVWVLDHRNLEGQRLALHIEIARVPQILVTQPQDLEAATAALDARIATARDGSAAGVQTPSPTCKDRASNGNGREPATQLNEHAAAPPLAALLPTDVFRGTAGGLPGPGCLADDGERCRR